MSLPDGKPLAVGQGAAFGQHRVGTPATLNLTLTNAGAAPLTLSTQIPGASPADFVVTLGPASILPPGGKTTMAVTFTPTVSGLRQASLHLLSNDSSNTDRFIPLAGTGLSLPVITPLHSSVLAYAQHTAVLDVAAEGGALSYQWLLNGHAVPGATSSACTIPGVTLRQAGTYTVRVSNAVGSVDAVASLGVVDIGISPANLGLMAGGSVMLQAPASGPGLSFQWLNNGTPVPGATSQGMAFATSGQYACNVTMAGAGTTLTTAIFPVYLVSRPALSDFSLPPATQLGYYAEWIAQTIPSAVASYTIKGLPRGLASYVDGYIFGTPEVAGNFKITVTARNAAGISNTVSSTLQVIPLPAGTAGTYTGVVARSQDLRPGWDLGGTLTFTVTAQGMVTGRLRTPIHDVPFTSRINVVGSSMICTFSGDSTGAVPYGVSMEVLPNENRADCLLSASNGVFVSFPAPRALDITAGHVAGDTDPATYAANYTLGLELLKSADQGLASNPQGTGFGGFKVSSTGNVTGVLRVADDSAPVVLAGRLGYGGTLPVYAPLYHDTGSLLGTLHLSPDASHGLDQSTLDWYKRQQTSPTRSYAKGFGPLALSVLGGQYVNPSRGQAAIYQATPVVVLGSTQASLTFSDGGAPSPATRLDLSSILIKPGSPSPVTLPLVNPGKVSLGITPGSGSAFTPGVTGGFDGSFSLADILSGTSVARLRNPFQGVIVSDSTGTPLGVGFFLLPALPNHATSAVLSGRVRLEVIN